MAPSQPRNDAKTRTKRFLKGTLTALFMTAAVTGTALAKEQPAPTDMPAATQEQAAPEIKEDMRYSDFIKALKKGTIEEVSVHGQKISIIDPATEEVIGDTTAPLNEEIAERLEKADVDFDVKPVNTAVQRFINMTAMFLFLGGFLYLYTRSMNGMGASKAQKAEKNKNKITLKDVAGVEEAKENMQEVVELLKDPKKFSKLGGRVPRGTLMVGPPGTGKTLMARAIAGEADVPFYYESGSAFVEMFVGRGAARMRSLFKRARKKAPCIIFIDEIDAVGGKRGMSAQGGHDEREQTLNQLLVEMDGFNGDEGIVVIAATNRPDVLDSALLRPGRFDRQIAVPLPDLPAREKILKVHMKNISLADDIDIHQIAKGTPGFSGADLAGLVNEAALIAGRRNGETVTTQDFYAATDKIMMGDERRSMALTEEEKKRTAYHEIGHALAGHYMPGSDPLHKISIIPRGRALGVTINIPEKDRTNYTKQEIDALLVRLYGGRVTEQLIFGEDKVTTGAANDIEKATEIAEQAIKKWGMSDKLGAINYNRDDGNRGLTKPYAEATAALIDDEIKAKLKWAESKAREIIEAHKDELHTLSKALMEYETLTGSEFHQIRKGGTIARKDTQPAIPDKPKSGLNLG